MQQVHKEVLFFTNDFLWFKRDFYSTDSTQFSTTVPTDCTSNIKGKGTGHYCDRFSEKLYEAC